MKSASVFKQQYKITFEQNTKMAPIYVQQIMEK